MMNGYLDPTSGPATIMVSGLPPAIASGGYDVYLYASGDDPSGTRTYGYAIGAMSISFSQTGPSPSTFLGYTLAAAGLGNYTVFHGVTGTSFVLTATPGDGVPSRAPVNGIQIVSSAGP